MAILGPRKKIEYNDTIIGRVWIFPDNVDTDAISPGQYLDDLKATLMHTCEKINPNFLQNAEEGDIIIGGKNFGCGSSRESAPNVLIQKGIVAIVAESFSRIFYRNCLAMGLPVLEIYGCQSLAKEGEKVKIDIPLCEIENLHTKEKMSGKKLPNILLEILKEGGLEEQLLKELKQRAKKIGRASCRERVCVGV